MEPGGHRREEVLLAQLNREGAKTPQWSPAVIAGKRAVVEFYEVMFEPPQWSPAVIAGKRWTARFQYRPER